MKSGKDRLGKKFLEGGIVNFLFCIILYVPQGLFETTQRCSSPILQHCEQIKSSKWILVCFFVAHHEYGVKSPENVTIARKFEKIMQFFCNLAFFVHNESFSTLFSYTDFSEIFLEFSELF